MAKESKVDHGLLLVVVGLLGLAVPGAGHFVIKERKRGIIIFVTIAVTFLVGIYVGSIGVIDSVRAWPWYIAQVMTSPTVAGLAHVTRGGAYICYGRANDIGQIYTSVAGLLNLLCVINAVYMAHSGRGEMIGHEEEMEDVK